MTDKKTEALKLALEKFANVKALCDKHGDKINRKHVYGGALIEHFDVVCQALAEQPAQKEPVAWHGYDLDGMVEAFDRVIQAHYNSKQPFHSPVDSDAQMALRILRGFIPSMKRYTFPPAQRTWVGLTEPEINDCYESIMFDQNIEPSRMGVYLEIEAKLKEKNT